VSGEPQMGMDMWGNNWGIGPVNRIPKQNESSDITKDIFSHAFLLTMQSRLKTLCKELDLNYASLEIVLPRITLDGIELKFGDVLSPLIRSKRMMNAEQARQAIYAGEPVVCSLEDYKDNVRDAIEDYRRHADDIGSKDLLNRCEENIKRLDSELKFKS